MDKKLDYTKRIDEVDASNTYIGTASPYASEDDSVWQIKKVIVSGTVTNIKYAFGNNLFDKKWSLRATYIYL